MYIGTVSGGNMTAISSAPVNLASPAVNGFIYATLNTPLTIAAGNTVVVYATMVNGVTHKTFNNNGSDGLGHNYVQPVISWDTTMVNSTTVNGFYDFSPITGGVAWSESGFSGGNPVSVINFKYR